MIQALRQWYKQWNRKRKQRKQNRLLAKLASEIGEKVVKEETNIGFNRYDDPEDAHRRLDEVEESLRRSKKQ